MTTTTPQRVPRSGSPTGYIDSYPTTVVGTAHQLANLFNHHRTAGTLIAVGRPVAVPHRPGHFQLQMRLRAAPVTTRTGLSRHGRLAVIATAVTGTIAGLVAAAAYLLGQLVELIAAHLGLLLGVAAMALLLMAALFRAGACPGIHCPGCRHR